MSNVLEYLEASAARLPEKTAVIDPDNRLTYAELVNTARSIGSFLAERVAPRSAVAVVMDKSVYALAAMMGAVYAGCFYVYISPDQPAPRAQQILKTATPGAIITDRAETGWDIGETSAYLYDTAASHGIDDARLLAVRASFADTDPLYCNFTSGSTGVPKGVLVCHRSVNDFIGEFTRLFELRESDVFANQAPFDFDVSVKDIYSAFKQGGTLLIIPKKLFSIVTRLLDYLADNGATVMTWAVSALCMVVQFKGLSYRVPDEVRRVMFSGELMPIKYLNKWREALPGAKFVNLYGPTEITCNCTYHVLERDYALDEQIPIGIPFPNERVFLLDGEGGEITESGVDGELCVAGTALALGYYNNPEATARAFVQNPLNSSYPETIYRTGDLAHYNDRSELCFAGRKDFQIKYMGHRIELEEIETALGGLETVERACCWFDSAKNRIAACFCGSGEPEEVKKQLYGLLPDYMVPALVYKMSELPLNSNGKIDRRRVAQEAK